MFGNVLFPFRNARIRWLSKQWSRGETSPGLVAGLDLLRTGIVARCQRGVWAGKICAGNLQLSEAKPLDDP